jgi:DNA-binding HxlR family transcriptional regulator
MYEKKIPENFECGISVALKILGGKWNSLVIEHIHLGARRPSELSRAIEYANPRVINMALKELEDYGILSKKVYNEIPLRTEYFLTTLGESILPIIDHMEQWGNAHRDEIVPDFSMPEKQNC